jgi:predicted Ser/Thr protein kinase
VSVVTTLLVPAQLRASRAARHPFNSPTTASHNEQPAGGQWTLLTEGADGDVYYNAQAKEVKKQFKSANADRTEHHYLQLLQDSGVTPRVIAYDNNKTIRKQHITGKTLKRYLLDLRGTNADEQVQRNFIHMLEKLREYRVNPNDSNLLNYIIENFGKVYRIDFAKAKMLATPSVQAAYQDSFMLATKIYKSFPLVVQTVQFLREPLLAYNTIPLAWRDLFQF